MLSIDRRLGFKSLLQMGFTPSKIGRLIDHCFDNGLLAEVDQEEVLTEEGMRVLISGHHISDKRTTGIWIMAMHKFRMDRSDETDIYLPPLKQLKWLG